MLAPGLIIDTRFTLTRRLDRGAMGEVWIARESEMRDVAIKFILPEQQSATLRERFLAEVKTAARLHSAYTCRVYHWGTHEGSPYMVMELLEGANLAERVRSFGRIDSVKLAVDYVSQACAALVEAHALGVVHRDIKPANLFLDERAQQIKVLDFGVAKATEAIRSSLSSPGGFVGTVAYSPPEQLVAASNVTVRSDIWSLGAVLYEILAGFPPFAQDFPEVLSAIAQREPRSLCELRPEVPEGLSRVIEKCLAKDPLARWADVTALLAELASYGGSESRAIAERILGDRDARRQTRYDALPDLHSEEALVEAVFTPRLAADGSQRRVVFMLGAGFSAPTRKRDGIPGTDDIVRLIKKQLPATERARLSQKLRDSSNKYQDAFEFLTATRSADAANAVIRSAVLQAYRSSATLPDSPAEQERKCREFEADLSGWNVPEGVSRLARIVATGLRSTREDGQKSAPYQRFSALHLTTNFDPLLAVSIRKHGGACLPYTVEKDFEIPEPEPDICLLVHLHGRWNRGDTLHNNLGVRRAHLEQSLSQHLERAVLVVLGYGGWDDVFMRTLRELTRGRSNLDVLWAHFSNDPQQIYREQRQLITDLQELGPRVQFYRGVDSNRFFARLSERLEESAGPRLQTDAPITTERRSERSAWTQGSSGRWGRLGVGALTIVAATGGALVWLRNPVNPVPAVTPPALPNSGTADAANPSPASALPRLSVACAEPVPSGSIRIDDNVLVPLQRLCAGRFETKLLVDDYPGLLDTKQAVLEPNQLFYEITLAPTPGLVSIRLERKERAQVEITVDGPGCTRFKTLRVKAADEPAQLLAELRRDDPGEASCQVKLSLPSSAWGRRVSFEFEPRGYRATDAEFLSSTLRTTLSRSEQPLAPKPVVPPPSPPPPTTTTAATTTTTPPPDPCAAKCRYIKSCRQDPQGGPCNGDDMAHIIACCSTVHADCRSHCN